MLLFCLLFTISRAQVCNLTDADSYKYSGQVLDLNEYVDQEYTRILRGPVSNYFYAFNYGKHPGNDHTIILKMDVDYIIVWAITHEEEHVHYSPAIDSTETYIYYYLLDNTLSRIIQTYADNGTISTAVSISDMK